MPYYAIQRLGDAVDATRAFLWPPDAGRWARLAVMALFVAGGAGTGGSFGGASSVTGTPGGTPVSGTGPPSVELSPAVAAAVVGAVVLALAVGLLVAVVAATMEFALVESLRTGEVSLRSYVARFWRRGVRLFAFRLGLLVLGVAAVAVLAALVLVPVALGAGFVGALLAVFAVPVGLVALVALAAAERFTTLFVVPVLLVEESGGVLAGWRRFRPTLVAHWRQYAVYAVVAFLLVLLTGVVAGVAAIVPVVVLAVPFGLLFLLGVALANAVFALGALVMVLAGVGFLLAALAAVAVIQVPLVAFLRFHALYVLGDTDADLDLVADRREPLE